MRHVFNAEVLAYQSMADLNFTILFGRITLILDPEMTKVLLSAVYGSISSFLPV